MKVCTECLIICNEMKSLDKAYIKTLNDEYLISMKSPGESIDFLAEASRNCSIKPSGWRREGKLLIDDHSNALAVSNLPVKGNID